VTRDRWGARRNRERLVENAHDAVHQAVLGGRDFQIGVGVRRSPRDAARWGASLYAFLGDPIANVRGVITALRFIRATTAEESSPAREKGAQWHLGLEMAPHRVGEEVAQALHDQSSSPPAAPSSGAAGVQ